MSWKFGGRKSFVDLAVGDRFAVREMLPSDGDERRFRYVGFKKVEQSRDADGLAFNAVTLEPMNGQFPDDAQVVFCELDEPDNRPSPPATKSESDALMHCTIDLVCAAIEQDWNDVLEIAEDLDSLLRIRDRRLSMEGKN